MDTAQQRTKLVPMLAEERSCRQGSNQKIYLEVWEGKYFLKHTMSVTWFWAWLCKKLHHDYERHHKKLWPRVEMKSSIFFCCIGCLCISSREELAWIATQPIIHFCLLSHITYLQILELDSTSFRYLHGKFTRPNHAKSGKPDFLKP